MDTMDRKIERRKIFAIHLSAFDLSAIDVIGLHLPIVGAVQETIPNRITLACANKQPLA